MKLIFAFGIAYQMPVAFTLLARVGIIGSKDLIAKWRYAVVGVFVAAAVLTPPDIVSQLSLATPMLALYGISILSCKWVERGRQNAAAGDAVAGEAASGEAAAAADAPSTGGEPAKE